MGLELTAVNLPFTAFVTSAKARSNASLFEACEKSSVPDGRHCVSKAIQKPHQTINSMSDLHPMEQDICSQRPGRELDMTV